MQAMSSSRSPFVGKDDDFLESAAAVILGGSGVATTTALRLARIGIDAKRLGLVLAARNREASVGTFKFKLIDADPETPDNFGVLVRSATPTPNTAVAAKR